MSAGKVLIGAVAGLAAGVTLGILFAPDKGSNTRKKLSKSGEDFMDGFKDKFEEYLELAQESLMNARDEAEEMLHLGKTKVEEVKKDTKTALS